MRVFAQVRAPPVPRGAREGDGVWRVAARARWRHVAGAGARHTRGTPARPAHERLGGHRRAPRDACCALVARVMARWRHGQAVASLQRWRAAAAHWRCVRRAAVLLSGAKRRGAFHHWLDAAGRRVRAQSQLDRAVCRWPAAGAGRALEHWRAVARGLARAWGKLERIVRAAVARAEWAPVQTSALLRYRATRGEIDSWAPDRPHRRAAPDGHVAKSAPPPVKGRVSSRIYVTGIDRW